MAAAIMDYKDDVWYGYIRGYGVGYSDGSGSGSGDGYDASSSGGYGYGISDGSGYGYGFGFSTGYGYGLNDGAGYGYGCSTNESYRVDDYWDAYWVPTRDHLVAVDVLILPNTELRRRLIELIGYSRFIQTASARMISEDRFGRLLEVSTIPVRFIELTDRTARPDGTFRLYWEPVPREIESPTQAVAWQWQFEVYEFTEMVSKGWIET